MTSVNFAILVFMSFALPVPLLWWLDRVPDENPKPAEKLREKL
ncbi:MAG TPA: hypothetical protein VMX16_13275 [Terriglobia bacterium]|nr:hypothetical protein [Terriglobia bacterium]